ncbi:PREDICTED: probable disease resistance protein At5g47250 [Camelina sativa]|uniref:Probable disease resistance protein At5g47250 n=1 Tax=Camelina sativa TaxID=90675 RepID=A0ABM0X691_CAMSA|nr:PREDICTED: probable disease resistance protein At5g47250 [Camelina sativa]
MGTIFETVCSAVERLRPVFNFLAAHGAYICKIEENLDDLKNSLEDLKAKRYDLLRQVDAEELRGGLRSAKWKGGFQKSKPLKPTPICWLMMLSLYSEGCQHMVVAGQAPPTVVVEEPVQQTFGLDTMLQRIWSLLRESDIRMLGLYGMGEWVKLHSSV